MQSIRRVTQVFPTAGSNHAKTGFLLGGYLGVFVVAESLAAGLFPVRPELGLWLHGLLLVSLLSHSVFSEGDENELYLAMAILPLIRLLAFSTPLWLTDQTSWLALVNLPLIAGTVVAAGILNYRYRVLGLNRKALPLQFLIATLGFGIGYLERLIIQPAPLAPSLELELILWPIVSLMLFTGLSEELLFRGVLQRAAVRTLGAWRGIIYISLLFGVMHIGWHSALDAVFVSAVGLLFGWLVYRTGSIVGVTLAHGIANIMLFVVLPNL